MHYIAGTKITIPVRSNVGGKIRPGMTSRQIQALKGSSTPDRDMMSKFKPGSTYTLTRIYKDESDMIKYKFISNGEVVVVAFNSILLAENFISGLKNEDVPDYTDVYRSNSN